MAALFPSITVVAYLIKHLFLIMKHHYEKFLQNHWGSDGHFGIPLEFLDFVLQYEFTIG